MKLFEFLNQHKPQNANEKVIVYTYDTFEILEELNKHDKTMFPNADVSNFCCEFDNILVYVHIGNDLKKKLIYSFDFDGTIVTNKFPKIGEPIQVTIDFIKKVKNEGNYIILNTMREGEILEEAVLYCKGLGIDFDAVNDNLQHMKDFYNNNPRKIFANYYVDDHNMFLEGVNYDERK